MEPFGLLNFLKSALSLAEQSPKPSEENLENYPQSSSPTSPPPEPIYQDGATEKQEKPNAFSAFIERHERVAKQFRK